MMANAGLGSVGKNTHELMFALAIFSFVQGIEGALLGSGVFRGANFLESPMALLYVSLRRIGPRTAHSAQPWGCHVCGIEPHPGKKPACLL